MKRITKRCIKIFFWSSVILSAYFIQAGKDLFDSLIHSAFFAFFIAVLYYIVYRNFIAKGKDKAVFDLSVSQEFEFYLSHMGISDIINQIASAAEDRGWRFKHSDGNIELSTGWSFTSFGERISIKVVAYNDEVGRISIKSQPRINFSLLDLGINEDNVAYIKSQII